MTQTLFALALLAAHPAEYPVDRLLGTWESEDGTDRMELVREEGKNRIRMYGLEKGGWTLDGMGYWTYDGRHLVVYVYQGEKLHRNPPETVHGRSDRDNLWTSRIRPNGETSITHYHRLK